MKNDPMLTNASLNCIEQVEEEDSAILNDPFYWYFRLEEIGKRAQTAEIVQRAVAGYNVDDPAYPILKVVSKRHLTREICEIAVSRNGYNLKYVPIKYQDKGLCLTAVQKDGSALSYVPDWYRSYDLCWAAVCNDSLGHALRSVPRRYLQGKEGRALCEAAVRANSLAIQYVPKRLMTKKLARLAIENPIPIKEVLRPNGSKENRNSWGQTHILEYIPTRYLSKELVELAISLYPKSLKFAPVEFVSHQFCLELVQKDAMEIENLPADAIDEEIIDVALKADPRVIQYIPEDKLTKELCLDALQKDPNIVLPRRFSDELRDEMEKEVYPAEVALKPIALDVPTQIPENALSITNDAPLSIYDLSTTDNSIKTVYYIADIHLEHQLELVGQSLYEIKHRIKDKVAELLASVPNTSEDILLIGGDVADSTKLEKLFYDELALRWGGKIISVLGNHELWDGDPLGIKPARSVDEIIDAYYEVMPYRVTMLENKLYVLHKGVEPIILDEAELLTMRSEELSQICSESTFLVLGGIGFSGLNPHYNADMGLYRSTVSMGEDKSRSLRFRAVYEKVLQCAKDLQVIILTHTQMANWSDAQYNPKWIYVSGHTHQNILLRQPDGTTVFADNQIGYKPKPWSLHGFTVDAHRYDPLEDYPDGIHQITREQYIEFNRCQGITMESMKYPGDLYAIKRDGIYLFVLKSRSSICLLEGGRPHRLTHNLDYYFDNLSRYAQKIQAAFSPYQKALTKISNEVKMLGGSGIIHGCIIDIDWFNHVYLNPFDGKVTPYFAWNTMNKWAYQNVAALLQQSPYPPKLASGSFMLQRYLTMDKEGAFSFLSSTANVDKEIVSIPEIVLDRSMYDPSRIMRSIQYVFDQNVVRTWNDEILCLEDKDISITADGAPKLLNS